MIKFKASEEQLKQMVANAINASSPMGLGFYSANMRKVYTVEDVNRFSTSSYICVDYFEGRMVKLRIKIEGNGSYSVHKKLSIDYQSWCDKFPTWKDLLESAGITEYEEVNI